MSHTPGPWKAWEYPPYQFDPRETWTISDSDGNDICTAEDMSSAEEAGANARLIAAAPELLVAAQNAVHALRYLCNNTSTTLTMQSAFNQLQDAIAKATGE